MNEEDRHKNGSGGDWFKQEGEVRTDMNCTHCSKNFVALLDFRLEGNWTIECAHCGHQHLRVIRGGLVSEDRWGSANGDQLDSYRPRRVWKSNVLPARTSSASELMRERWLQKL